MRIYYGEFHVIIKRFDGLWKLVFDYDSDENGAIGEERYKSAFAIDEYEKY